MKGLALAAVTGVLLFAPADAAAQADEAQRLFTEGTQLLAQKRLAEACSKLEASQKMQAAIGTALYLGACYEAQSRWASAVVEFKLAEQMSAARGDARQSVARARIDRIMPKVSQATVKVPEGDTSIHVALDNVELPRATWQAVPLDPGPHTFVASAPGKKRWTLAVSTPMTALASVVAVPPLDDADVAPAPIPAPAPAAGAEATPAPKGESDRPAAAGIDGRQIAGLAVSGLGVVALGFGSYFGLHAKSQFDDSSPHCRADDHCDTTGAQLRTDAKSSALTSTILFGAGAAMVAGGLVLYFTGGRASTSAGGVAMSIASSAAPGQARLSLVGSF